MVYSNILIVSHGEAFPSTTIQVCFGSFYLLIGSFVHGILFGMIINSIELANLHER